MNDEMHIPPPSGATRFALRIGALYAVLGVTWILSTDAIVKGLFTDATSLSVAQRYKGLFYILITAAALVLLVRQGYLRLLRADAQARSNELGVRDLFAHHPQPMFVIDTDSLRFLQVNDAARANYGYSEGEFLAMTLRDLRAPEDAARLDTVDRKAPPDFREVGIVRHWKRSGEIIHVRITAHTVTYAGRMAVMSMAVDVTAEVLSARALERQEAQFRQLHQSLGEVLWFASAETGEMLYVSPASEAIYGRHGDELRRDRQLWLKMVHPDDRAIAVASNDNLWSVGHSNCEYRIVRPDGTVRWISDRKSIIVDADGLTKLIGGIAEDVTAVKERDEARATTQASLEAMVASRTAELQYLNDELSVFTQTAAHDLKSPLAGIAGLSYLLSLQYGPALGAGGVQKVQQIESAARHIASLVDDLLSLSTATSIDIHRDALDLTLVAHAAIAQLQQLEPNRSVLFDAPATLVVRMDAGLAKSLMWNLLGNAWKFTGKQEHPAIHLSASTVDGQIIVKVQDNGAGFDAESASNLFKPFQRFHSAHDFTGTGIGLVTCLRIVQRHGGKIWASSRPGEGAAFFFSIPNP